MEPFHQHVFVCTQEKPEGVVSCPNQGSLGVLQDQRCKCGRNRAIPCQPGFEHVIAQSNCLYCLRAVSGSPAFDGWWRHALCGRCRYSDLKEAALEWGYVFSIGL